MISEKDRKESRQIQIKLLDEVKRICDKHNLTYWIDFGTLLGSLRYKGFIPWDDDIDVSMPLRDYRRFLKISMKELPHDIFLQTNNTDPYYKQAFAKLRDCNSTFLEHHETGEEKYHTGIYIDIFPSVYYPIMPHIIKKILLRLTVTSRGLAVVKSERKIINYPIYWICKTIWLLLSPFKGNKIGRTVEDNGYYESIPDNYLYPLKPIEFERKFYNGPSNIHKYLSLMYGKNYLTPPPIEKRIPHAKVILPHTPCNHPRSIIISNANKKLAPVAIFVYNRLKNTTETLEALKNNYLAKDTDIFIFSDAPASAREIARVAKVREYIRSLSGFKSVTIIERKTNYYIEKNIIDGVTDIINKFGRVIVLEDDGVSTNNFLTFMNSALDFYYNEKKVMHISTFTFIKMPENYNKTFFVSYTENTGGGWATWNDRWDKFKWFQNEQEGLAELTDEQKIKIEMNGVFKCLGNLKRKPIPWDICWSIAIIKNGGLTVNSPVPLIRNNGLYNGTHFSIFNILYGKSLFDIETQGIKEIIFDKDIRENETARELIKDFYIKFEGKERTMKNILISNLVSLLVKLKITKFIKRIIS